MGHRQGRANAPLLGPGTWIAERYVVVRILGEGGMGQVFEVEHEALGRHFALKVLNITPCSDETLRRFRREARALGRVTTPRVAQVTDFGVDENLGPYYVMELLDGETLEDRLERVHHLSVSEAIPIAIDLCEALSEVHGTGIIHRDLKPSNVGLTRAGPIRCKLLDFGLAAAVDGTALERITRSQEVVGSLPYMAPERFHNAPLTLSVDLYALGVVLFEMLTGELPFDGTTAAVVINQHLNQSPRAFDEAAPGLQIPGAFGAVVRQLLEKDPTKRFLTAAGAARALQEATIAAPIPTLADENADPSVAVTMLAGSSDELSALAASSPRSGATLPADSEASRAGVQSVQERVAPSEVPPPGVGVGIPTAFVPDGTPNPDVASWPRASGDPSVPLTPTMAQIGSFPSTTFDPSVATHAGRGGPGLLRVVTILIAGVIGSVLAAVLAFLVLWDDGSGDESPRPALRPQLAPLALPPPVQPQLQATPPPAGPQAQSPQAVLTPFTPPPASPTPPAPPAPPVALGSVLAGSTPPPILDAGPDESPEVQDGGAQATPLRPPPHPPAVRRPPASPPSRPLPVWRPQPPRPPPRRPPPRRWTGGIIDNP